jgi:TRAP-type C4-dicarboxylate transport system permease small subunit
MAELAKEVALEIAPETPKRAAGAMDKVANFCAALAGVSLIAIFVLEIVEITLRNLFGRSTMFADEMCGYLNVAVVFLGLAYTLARGGFIRVEILYKRFRGRVKAAADWYAVIVSLAFVATILDQMIRYTLYSFLNDVRSPEVTATPQYLPQLVLVVGMAVLVAQLLAFVFRRCRDLP